MKLRSVHILTVGIICLLCAVSAYAGGDETQAIQAPAAPALSAVGGPPKTITLGSLDANTGFKFLVELTTRGAGIEKATLSQFDNLGNRQPLVLLSPTIKPSGSTTLSMENGALVIADYQLQVPLDKLDWNMLDVVKSDDGSETVTFEAAIKDKATGEQVIKLIKTYRVRPGIYDIDCSLTIENFSTGERKIQFEIAGPVGIDREDPRADTRKAIGAFRSTEGQILSASLDIKKLSKPAKEDRQLVMRNAGFLWAATVNKYFAAIVVPMPDANMNFCNWIAERTGWHTDPDGQPDSGDETIGLDLKTTIFTLAAKGQPQNSRTFDFELFIGPKDKSVFDKNKLYKDLGFVHTIDFMACCCPAAIIYPLGFGILAIMKWLYGFIPNYGVVIIILVLLVRLILHPLTRKSQISMSAYSKFTSLPEVQEIRKKYGKDPMEMHRKMGEVQKKYGVSHSAAIMGMLPTMVQMPIWIALYGAIYASIDLRGAEFLPFWITDLSSPDALFKFRAIAIPLFGRVDSFNLLPILMGIAFYLQQKLTPSQSASTDPQMAQQQKIMMIMMPVMFPLMLYTSPSGLNLYIMASVFGGVIEQYIIKKHIQQKDQVKEEGLVDVTSKTGGKLKKKKPKPFFKI